MSFSLVFSPWSERAKFYQLLLFLVPLFVKKNNEHHAQQCVRCVWGVEVEASRVMGAKGGVQICREGYVWGKFNKQKTGLGNRLDGPSAAGLRTKCLPSSANDRVAGANSPEGRRKVCRV